MPPDQIQERGEGPATRHPRRSDRIAQWSIQVLALLRQVQSEPKDFWQGYLEGICVLYQARQGLILVRESRSAPWSGFETWPGPACADNAAPALLERAAEMADAAMEHGYLSAKLMGSKSRKNAGVMVAKRLDIAEGQPESVLVLLLESQGERSMDDLEIYLKLIAEIPAIYQKNRSLNRAREDVYRFAEAFDILLGLNQEERYMAAAMGLCNELAAKFNCTRASLGWQEKGYVRIKAISHTEKFDPKMAIVQALEMVMEESFDQNEEISWPQQEDGDSLARDHGIFAREQGTPHLLSVPLRNGKEPVGIVVLERAENPFSELEIKTLRVICDLALRRRPSPGSFPRPVPRFSRA